MKALLLSLAAMATVAAPADPRRSGYDDMTPELQAMQRDDSANPAMLAVQEGEALWNQPAGSSGKSCAGCHGDAPSSMRGVAARYPAFDIARQGPVDLGQRIQACRTRHQGAPAFAPESEAQLALESYVALQSRGMRIDPVADPRLQAAVARGEGLFRERLGQLDLSCAHCHDLHAGQHLGGATIPQAHPTGYPIYRLEWQGMGSLKRRLKGCMAGVRAEPFAEDAPEWTELALYLNQRAAGMAIDAPAIRP